MKLGKTIKKYIGLIYAFVFSFALCGSLVTFKNKAMESKASFTGTFSVNSQTKELEYSPADSYIFKSISMPSLVDQGSGNFDLEIEIYGMEPTGGDSTKRESGTLFFIEATWREEQGTGDYGNYVGILSGKCSEINEGAEVSFRTYTAPNYSTQEDGGWDNNNDELSYWSEEYNVSDTVQTAITYDEYNDYTLTYEIYGFDFETPDNIVLKDTKYIHIRDATYSPADEGNTEYYGIIYGSADEIDEPASIIVKAVVEPEYVPIHNYQNGWNYIEDDHTLVYFDYSNPRGDYTFSWVTFAQYNCEAVINFVGTLNGASDPQAAQIWNAVYDHATETISGDLAVLNEELQYASTNIQVELKFNAGTVEEIYTDGWNYSQTKSNFVYSYYDESTDKWLEPEATYSGTFHHSSGDPIDQYVDITCSVQLPGENDPRVETYTIYEANKYEINADECRITGKIHSVYNEKTYTIPVNFIASGLDTVETKFHEFDYDSNSHAFVFYYDDFTPCRTQVKKVVFNDYGDTDNDPIKYNTIYIYYNVTDPDTEEVFTPMPILLYDAKVTEDNDVYCEGELSDGQHVSVAVGSITITNTVVDGFNYIYGLDYEELIYFDATTREPYSVSITSIDYNVNAEKITVKSNRIDLETHESTENEDLILDYVEIIQNQTDQQNGIVKAFFKGGEVTLTTPILTRSNDGPSKWEYNEGQLKWYVKEEDDRLEPQFNYAALNEDTNVMTIIYILPYEEFTENEEDNIPATVHVALQGDIEFDGSKYVITGPSEEIGTEVTLRIDSYETEHTGWDYTSDGLRWYDAVYREEVTAKCTSASFNTFISVTTIKYSLQYEDLPNSTSSNIEKTLHIKNSTVNSANFGDNEIEYTVVGDCIELEQYVELRIYEPPGVFNDETTGWRYDIASGLTWVDATYDEISWTSTYAVFNEDKQEIKIAFNLAYSAVTLGEIGDRTPDQLVLTNANYEEKETGDGKVFTVSGESSALGGNISLSVPYLEIMRTGWNYANSDGMYPELYWTELNEEGLNYNIVSQLISAVYKEETSTVEFKYGIFSYEITGDGNPDGKPEDEKPTLIEEKLIHMQKVTKSTVTSDQNPEFNETYYFFTGECVECPEAGVLSVPESLLTIIPKPEEYDPNAGTITDDQQEEIKDLLPEETTVDEQRMEESIVAISSETAHEIIVVVNDAHEQNDAALAAGEITQEQYDEKKKIIQTVTEVAVVVGAGATTASEEGKAVDNALPDDHDLGFTMDETLNEFYQTQLEYLLGKKEAPEKEGDDSRLKLRAGGTAAGTYDITNVSKEDYKKMIDFVDTAVSNMKDAALQIRKCSCAAIKVEVKDYITKVKISSFRDFDEKAANDEFVETVKTAILLNMQQQVIQALEQDHKPSNNADKEMVYQQQLAACKDFDTFKEIVLEVLRQKYMSLTKQDIEITLFEPIYDNIFRSWALDDPSLNTTGITLEQLTTATIETTKSNASKFTYRETVSKEESIFLIAFGSAVVIGVGAAIATPLILSKTKHRRRAR